MDISAQLIALLTQLGVGPVWLLPITAVMTLLLNKYFPSIKLSSLKSLIPFGSSPTLTAEAQLLQLMTGLTALKGNDEVKSQHIDFIKMLVEDLKTPANTTKGA